MIDILIVEDNKELGTLLHDFLVAEGYTVLLVESGEEALACLSTKTIRLIILDIMLPGIDGFAVCSKIREEYNTPIIVVSAKVGKEDKLNGLLLGADDYIEKPYDIDILLAKIKGIFRRSYNSNILIDGNIKINREKSIAYCDGKELPLTAKEYKLLLLLVENKGRTLKKDWIFNKIWGFDSFSEPQTLTVHIKWLRKKIEDDPKNPKRILTVWGVGYRFEGESQ
ncbi:MAG: response regulator transcription factor [Clostridiales bacterium]|nr:response regulator transcription factor [Clostridiales bacterium]